MWANSGTYNDTLWGGAWDGSDSVVTINLTIKHLSAGLTETAPSCDLSNGSITSTPTGGIGTSFTWLWSNGGNTNSITSLGAGTYSVTVDDGNGCFAYEQVSFTNACPAPTDMKATQLQDVSVKLSWTEPCAGFNYRILYKPVGSGPWTTVMQSNGKPTKKLINLTADTKYMYRIATMCNNGPGPLTDAEFFTTLAQPCVVPTGLSTTPIRADQARFNWTQQTNVNMYKIRWRQTGGSWTLVEVGNSRDKYWLTGLAASTSYEWQIKTVCIGDPGKTGTEWSAVQSFTTDAANKQAMSMQPNAAGGQLRASVYPNPTSGSFNVAVPLEGAYDISVLNALGQQVMQLQQVSGPLQQLQLNAKGMYLVRISTANYTDVQRVIVQ